MARLRVAFFGSSLVSAYWNGAATYYRGMLRALFLRGHEITFYEPNAYQRQAHRDIEPPSWARVVVYACDTEEDVLSAVEQAQHADLIVKASGVGVFDELLEASVLDLQSPGRTVVFWDVDAPATLERVTNAQDDPFLALIPRYDAVLTYGGGQPVVDTYIGLGARCCVPIYNAFDPETHYPVPPEPRFAADVAFLGNRLPDREERVQRLFFDAAAREPQAEFLLGGAGWDDVALPRNVRYVGHVYTTDHNALNCSSGSVLNISRESMAKTGYSPATRVFEAAGVGACLISDVWKGIDLFLEPGREVLTAGDAHDLVSHLRSLRPEKRYAIGQAARKRVLAEHTYAHRAKLFEKVFSA